MSRSGVVDNTLDYQSRDRKIDPPLFRSFGWNFKPWSRLCMTSLLVGHYTRVHSLTHLIAILGDFILIVLLFPKKLGGGSNHLFEVLTKTISE